MEAYRERSRQEGEPAWVAVNDFAHSVTNRALPCYPEGRGPWASGVASVPGDEVRRSEKRKYESEFASSQI